MAKAYPSWRRHYHWPLGGWEGPIQPLPPGSPETSVLSALAHGGDFDVLPNGVLRPVADSGELPRWLRNVRGLQKAFWIRVFYRRPPAIPLAISLSPLITRSRYPSHPHLYDTGEKPTDPAVLCPFLPPDGLWAWERNNVAEFLHYVSIWLVCHQVYERKSRWPAPAASHKPKWLLENVGPEAYPCVCGSAARYGDCCRSGHSAFVEGVASH